MSRESGPTAVSRGENARSRVIRYRASKDVLLLVLLGGFVD
jgi:hypothetical protein